ncbi:RidA family protein [bacterium]|nr:RidA family protein [bacterium]
MDFDKKLSDLGIDPGSPAMPVANYLPYRLHGNILYLSGMIPVADGKPLYTGRVGDELTVEQGQECARQCVINGLGWVRQALGSLNRVDSFIRIRGFVACPPGFGQQPQVVNGASDLLVEIFGDAGRHTRAAVGSVSLPLNVPVEIDFTIAVRSDA